MKQQRLKFSFFYAVKTTASPALSCKLVQFSRPTGSTVTHDSQKHPSSSVSTHHKEAAVTVTLRFLVFTGAWLNIP